MKKLIVKITVFLSALLLVNCEDAPLDRDFISDEDIGFIEIVLEDDQLQKADPDNDSGLPPEPSTLTGKTVKIFSSNKSNDIIKRVWRLPDPNLVDREEVFAFGEDIVKEGDAIDDVIETVFQRGNRQDTAIEFTGYPIILFETSQDGTVRRYQTNLTVRTPVQAEIAPVDQGTINELTTINPVGFVGLGLASTDFSDLNQARLTWSIDPSSGFIIDSIDGNGDFVGKKQVAESSVEGQGKIVFTALGDQKFTLKIERFWPVPSVDIKEYIVKVVPGLVPNGGGEEDPISLSPDGSTIFVRYSDQIVDISDIKLENFQLSVDVSEVNQDFTFEINSLSLNTDADDRIQFVLGLNDAIPAVLMDNVTLSYDYVGLRSINNIRIDTFSNFIVSPTGMNELNATYAGFEVEADSWDNAWENHFTELIFTTERSFTGAQSLLFDVTSNPGGIGAWRQETAPDAFVPSVTGDYQVSYWVYVESADPAASINMFWLDGSSTQWSSNVGAVISTLEQGKWVKVSGTRFFDVDKSETKPFVRIVGGNAKVYLDDIDIRPL